VIKFIFPIEFNVVTLLYF